jgi:hypothetical protein
MPNGIEQLAPFIGTGALTLIGVALWAIRRQYSNTLKRYRDGSPLSVGDAMKLNTLHDAHGQDYPLNGDDLSRKFS